MPTVTAPPTAGAARLVVLLGLLGLAIAALIYDYAVAGPGIEAAEKKLNEYADERNRQAVDKSGPITPDDIHKELGMQPTFVEKHPDKYYLVEYYCWWGRVPVINLRRHYLALVYTGEKTMRFSSQYKNEPPPPEGLPIEEEAPEQTAQTPPLSAPDSSGSETKSPTADETPK